MIRIAEILFLSPICIFKPHTLYNLTFKFKYICVLFCFIYRYNIQTAILLHMTAKSQANAIRQTETLLFFSLRALFLSHPLSLCPLSTPWTNQANNSGFGIGRRGVDCYGMRAKSVRKVRFVFQFSVDFKGSCALTCCLPAALDDGGVS